MLTPENTSYQVSDVLNFTSQCAIQRRCVPLNAFPKQVEKLLLAIELINRRVCKSHLSKDVKNKIISVSFSVNFNLCLLLEKIFELRSKL